MGKDEGNIYLSVNMVLVMFENHLEWKRKTDEWFSNSAFKSKAIEIYGTD
jgi:hypothetical protein